MQIAQIVEVPVYSLDVFGKLKITEIKKKKFLELSCLEFLEAKIFQLQKSREEITEKEAELAKELFELKYKNTLEGKF